MVRSEVSEASVTGSFASNMLDYAIMLKIQLEGCTTITMFMLLSEFLFICEPWTPQLLLAL